MKASLCSALVHPAPVSQHSRNPGGGTRHVMKETHCGHFPIMFSVILLPRFQGLVLPLLCPSGDVRTVVQPLFLSLSMHQGCCFPYKQIVYELYTVISMDVLKFFFFGHFLSYSFNLFYWFILVMRNNIKIVEFLFFLFFSVDLSFSVIFTKIHAKPIRNYKQYVFLLRFFSLLFLYKGVQLLPGII